MYFFSSVYFSFFTGLSDCVQIEQPSDLITKVKDNVKISCKHDRNNLDVMLWYQRRKESTALALMGYSYATLPPNNEAEFPETQFKQNRINTVSGDLTISNLNLSDSAVYYCAARIHSASGSSPAWLKTWKSIQEVQAAALQLTNTHHVACTNTVEVKINRARDAWSASLFWTKSRSTWLALSRT